MPNAFRSGYNGLLCFGNISKVFVRTRRGVIAGRNVHPVEPGVPEEGIAA
ncbi:MAG: hypothetical protein KDA81_04595 [Planctomycetaceae bacterium]|nr:hypothetical protein [Planctomycetaceae bacterium]